MTRVLVHVQPYARLGKLLLASIAIASALAACGTSSDEESVVEEHFNQGNEYARNGEFEKAVAEYQAALEIDPDHVSVLTNLGVSYYSLGKLSEAIEQYRRALDIAPDDADIHSNLAAAHVQSGNIDIALDEYLTAVELDPELAEAHFGLGVIHLQLGQTDEAILAFERFQELDQGQDPIASEKAEEYLQQLRGQ